MPLPITDTRPFFRPLCLDILALLRSCSDQDWERPTMAGAWRVRDVVAHLIDTALRRISFHRDGRTPPALPRPIAGERDFAAFIDDVNATWVRAAERLSARALTDLYAHASGELADFVEGLRLDDVAYFPVSWAGEAESRAWLDIGREFTEVWHHGSQIRDAVGAGPFAEPRWLHAVLSIALHALPYVYRDVAGRPGESLTIAITGLAGGTWTLQRREQGWDIDEGDVARPAAKATMSDETAWRLLFNALQPAAAQKSIRLEGDTALGLPLLRARSVIV